MFAKPFKVKSNNSLKNTEKKLLIQRIINEFPAATEEMAKELVPLKASCSSLKLVLNSREPAEMFVVAGVPLLIVARNALLPTVLALWRVPTLLPSLTVHDLVLGKIQGGAPLYLPGVVLPGGAAGLPMFARGALLALRTRGNLAAAAVGLAAMSSGDMLLKASGVCLEMMHWMGDMLCREPRFGRIERPLLVAPAAAPAPGVEGLADRLAQFQMHTQTEEWPALGHTASSPCAPAPAPAYCPALSPAPAPLEMQVESDTPHDDGDAAGDVPEDMDGLLEWALLGFLKLHGRSLPLPILSSLLYRNYLLPLCPPGRTLDVKKSSYKKVSKFLEAMEKEGYLQVREVEKGVEAVTALNAAHPRLRSHAAPAPAPAPAPPDDGDELLHYSPPLVRETFSVTAAVADLLKLKKGTTLSAGELRDALTEYVRARALAAPAPAPRGSVLLDNALAAALHARDQDCIKWEALMSGVQSKMTPCTEMRFPDGTVRLTKAKLAPVRMDVASRSGNKKVTLVSNLEAFGFSLPELARACQRGVAASCGVTRAPGAKHDQLMLQGDQTYYMARLLIEKYGLPKKFVENADKALKKKKS